MTLRGVIQDLLRGSDDAETMLADEGYGDLPPEMFGQALASYADTAPMAEADALTPVLGSIEQGDASDTFAILEAQPPVMAPGGDAAALATSVVGVESVLDETAEVVDDFGTAAPDTTIGDDDADLADNSALEDEVLEDSDPADDALDDPFGADTLSESPVDSAGEFEALEDFFDTEPVASGDDPSDLDF